MTATTDARPRAGATRNERPVPPLPPRQPRRARHARRLRRDDGDLHRRQSAGLPRLAALQLGADRRCRWRSSWSCRWSSSSPSARSTCPSRRPWASPPGSSRSLVQAGFDPFLAHRRGDRHRHRPRRLRRRARRLCRPLVADRHARHELHAARPDPDHHRGQVDRAARRSATLAAYQVFSSSVAGIPVQIFWALAFVVFSAFLYNRHRFGARSMSSATIPTAPRRWASTSSRIRIATFMYHGPRRRARRRASRR